MCKNEKLTNNLNLLVKVTFSSNDGTFVITSEKNILYKIFVL